MLKGMGGIIIIFSVIMLSCYPLYQRRQRMIILRDFLQDLRYIHNELRSNLSSVPELIVFLCRKSGFTTNTIYHTLQTRINDHGVALFYEDWICVLNQYNAYLMPEEYNILLNVGDVLGKYVLEEQLAAINSAIQIFEESYLNTKAEYHEKKKLNLGIGTSLGLILIILLV